MRFPPSKTRHPTASAAKRGSRCAAKFSSSTRRVIGCNATIGYMVCDVSLQKLDDVRRQSGRVEAVGEDRVLDATPDRVEHSRLETGVQVAAGENVLIIQPTNPVTDSRAGYIVDD